MAMLQLQNMPDATFPQLAVRVLEFSPNGESKRRLGPRCKQRHAWTSKVPNNSVLRPLLFGRACSFLGYGGGLDTSAQTFMCVRAGGTESQLPEGAFQAAGIVKTKLTESCLTILLEEDKQPTEPKLTNRPTNTQTHKQPKNTKNTVKETNKEANEQAGTQESQQADGPTRQAFCSSRRPAHHRSKEWNR